MGAEGVSRTASGKLKTKFRDGTVAKTGVLPQAPPSLATAIANVCFKPSTGSPTHFLSPHKGGGSE